MKQNIRYESKPSTMYRFKNELVFWTHVYSLGFRLCVNEYCETSRKHIFSSLHSKQKRQTWNKQKPRIIKTTEAWQSRKIIIITCARTGYISFWTNSYFPRCNRGSLLFSLRVRFAFHSISNFTCSSQCSTESKQMALELSVVEMV